MAVIPVLSSGTSALAPSRWQSVSDTRMGDLYKRIEVGNYELVQLTGIRLHFHPEEGEHTTVTIPHQEIEKEGSQQLQGNLYKLEEEPTLLAVPTPEIDDFTGTVDIDLFFSIVPVV